MITVDSCLCFKLETGGLIIGWLSFIGNILCSILFAIIFILLCVFSCEDFQEQLDPESLDLCNAFHGVLIGVSVVVIGLCIGFAYIAYRCIQGTRTRDHFKVKPMMIMLGVVAVLSALQILSLSTAGIVHGLIEFAINAYFFLVIYSLYDLFRREYESGGNRHNLQYQVAGKV